MIGTRRLVPYLKVWMRLTSLQFESQVANARGAAVGFILGKLFRFLFAFVMVYVIVGRAKALAGYNLQEAILILAFFNLIQTLNQLFFRGVYMFRQKVQDGSFDFYLLNPLSELFYSLFSYTDALDVLMILPYTVILGWAWVATGYPVTLATILLILLVIAISMLFVFALHVVVVSIGVRYLEVDNTIMLYRDVEKMAAFPINMYGKFGSIFLTYIIPFGLMATVPANIVFGLVNPWVLGVFAVLVIVQVKLALLYWRRSLLTYSSASS